jgi:hypothetical protein
MCLERVGSVQLICRDEKGSVVGASGGRNNNFRGEEARASFFGTSALSSTRGEDDVGYFLASVS